ncbi:MAG: TRAP transporter small permease subunit [Chloroflexota bacterium]
MRAAAVEEPDAPAPRRLAPLEWVALGLVGLLFTALLVQVLGRPFGLSFVWIGELSIPLFVWIVFVGAAIASRRNEHPYVEIGYSAVSRRLSPRGRKALDLLLAAMAIAFFLVFIAGLIGMTRQTWDHVPGLLPGYRVGYLYLGTLVGALGCLIATIRRLRERWRQSAGDDGRGAGDSTAASII